MVDVDAARRYHGEREARRRAQREAERQQWLQRVCEAVVCLAPRYPGVRRVYLFGSLAQAGRFWRGSDIDLAVECDSLETGSAFWQALERYLRRDVDVRPMIGAMVEFVASGGEKVYER